MVRTLHLTEAVNKNLAYDTLLEMFAPNLLDLAPQQTERTTHTNPVSTSIPQPKDQTTLIPTTLPALLQKNDARAWIIANLPDFDDSIFQVYSV